MHAGSRRFNFLALVTLLVLCGALVATPGPVWAQRVLLDEDFENDVPDALPASADTFNRSVATWR